MVIKRPTEPCGFGWDHEYSCDGRLHRRPPCQQVSAAARRRRAMRLDPACGTASHDLRHPSRRSPLGGVAARTIDDPEVCRILAKIHSTAQGRAAGHPARHRLDLGVIAPKPSISTRRSLPSAPPRAGGGSG
ncbi:MAG: hypothetical protein U1E95_07380 [Rubrivivax sp.]